MGDRRRRPLNVPTMVVAPWDMPNDIGDRDFRSMCCSPDNSFTFHQNTKGMGDYGLEISDDDAAPDNAPPDHDTYLEYITFFDEFMWDLQVRPGVLKTRVGEMRQVMRDERESDFWEGRGLSGERLLLPL